MKFTLTGNIFLQLGTEAKPAPIPIQHEIEYTENSMSALTYATAQTNTPLPMGTVTTPRVIVLEVAEGTVAIGYSPTGVAAWNLAKSPTALSSDPPARAIWITDVGIAGQLYLNTTGPCRFKIWLFE